MPASLIPFSMIDIHCHILPNMDDGPQEIDESIEMAKMASKDGIEKIIATPHIYDNRFSSNDITDRVDQLNHLLNQKKIPIQVYPGAEVAIGLDPEKLSGYTINHSAYILIEFPHDHLPSYAGKMLEWLCAKGLKPIIAHPERNYSIIRSPEILLSLLNDNVYTQITADSLTGDFGRDIQYCANFLLDSGKVDIIASDAHSKDFRPPRLSAAARLAAKRLGKKASQRLVYENPAAILKGEKIHSN
jgi:protein-tyrosine phosphatase